MDDGIGPCNPIRERASRSSLPCNDLCVLLKDVSGLDRVTCNDDEPVFSLEDGSAERLPDQARSAGNENTFSHAGNLWSDHEN